MKKPGTYPLFMSKVGFFEAVTTPLYRQTLYCFFFCKALGPLMQVQYGIDRVEASRGHLYQLAQGGTAVGTGLNAKKGFAEKVAAVIGEETGYPFITAPNK